MAPEKFCERNHLSVCSYAFVRHDGVRIPFQAPYDGPCKVLVRKEETFDVEIKETKQIVSLDRLKPTFISMGTDISPELQTNHARLTHLITPSTSRVETQPVPVMLTTRTRWFLWLACGSFHRDKYRFENTYFVGSSS